MAQHKASLEKTLQSGFKHKKAGTEVATTILAVEALVAAGLGVVVENTDEKVIGRTRASVAHKAFGKRIADAITTLDAIIADAELDIVAEDVIISGFGAPHKQNLRRVMRGAMTSREIGLMVSDMVSKCEKVVDALLVEYGEGGASEDEDIAAALQLIKDALAA